MTGHGLAWGARGSIPLIRVAALALPMAAATIWVGSSVRGAEVCEERPTMVSWDGDAGTLDWAEPTNWSDDTVPGPGAHVCVALDGASVSLAAGAPSIASLQVADGSGLVVSGGVTLSLAGPEPSDIAALGLYGGTLGVTGTLSLTGSAVLDAGALAGNGTTSVAPGATLQVGSGSGGVLAVGGGHVLRVEEGATMTWGPGPHDIAIEAPSRLENAGTVEITNDRTLTGSGSLANLGTLAKRSHGQTGVALVLDNDGTLEVAGGVLDVTGGDGGLGSDGAVDVAAGARLRLREGATTLGPAAAMGGAGSLELTTNASLAVPATATYAVGTTVLTGGALSLDGGERELPSLGLYGGTLGVTGTLSLTGSAVLDAGALAGNGTTSVAPGATLQVGSGSGGVLAVGGGHVLRVEEGATMTWGPGPHDIAIEAPSRLENAGTVEITNDRTLTGSGSLANLGTLAKRSHGQTGVALVLDNDGTLEVAGGVLDVTGGDGGLGSDGAVDVAAGARLRLREGATTLGPAAAMGGAGSLELTTNASLAVPATATYAVGTTVLTGGALSLDGGERELPSLGLYGGTLGVTGTLSLTGSAVLDAGALAGNGTTSVAPGATLQVGSGSGGVLAVGGGHVLRVEEGATMTWGPGPHDIAIEAPSRLENAGTVEITNDRTLTGSGSLANLGTLAKRSHGQTGVALVLDNDGTLEVAGGVLDVTGGDGGLGSDGAVDVAAGARLRLREGATTLGPAAAMGGAGSLELTTNASLAVPATATYAVGTTVLTGGALSLDGGERELPSLGLYGGTLGVTGTLSLTGSAVLDAGALAGNGTTSVAPGATLQVGSGSGGVLAVGGGHVLRVEEGATMTWGPGPHDIAIEAPSRLENAGTVEITNDRTLTGSGSLANLGTLAKRSHGQTGVALGAESQLANDGQLVLSAGILDVAGGLVNRGTVRLSSDTPTSAAVLRTLAFSQTAEGVLELGLGGRTPYARVGSLNVTGTGPELAGTLSLVPEPGFQAASGQVLVLILAPGGPVGAFDTVTGADSLPGGQSGNVRTGAERVELVIGDAPD